MAKIVCPNKQYNGISASVAFVNGIGETANPHLIKWFKDHGYIVEQEETENPVDPPKEEEPNNKGEDAEATESTEEVEQVKPEASKTRKKSE